MSLIEELTSFCSDMYNNYGECEHCSHPSGHCSGGCLFCSEEVNYHRAYGRRDYNCQKFLYYYVCRYSWKYCSEIIYALKTVDLHRYPEYRILSLGCGGTPDLMAFEETNSEAKKIMYRGYDMNPYWTPIHNKIQSYTSNHSMDVKLFRENIFNIIEYEKNSGEQYNVIILEYLISHFSNDDRDNLVQKLLDGVVQISLNNRYPYSPFLIIINDIDHYNIREAFEILIDKLQRNHCHGSSYKRHFKIRSTDYGDNSIRHSSCLNCFSIPENQKRSFNCAIMCTSAQMIIEVR